VPGSSSPLDGVRVLDLSQVFSGPYATRILGDLGADVVKLESIGRPDPERGEVAPTRPAPGRYPDNEPGDEPYNRAARFVEYNRNKRGITLDLRSSDGLRLCRRLVALADVVIENFSVGVMDRLGLGYDALRSLRRDTILVSLPAFGDTGPEQRYVAFGPQQECLTGLVGISGYSEDRPVSTSVYYPDPMVAVFAVSAIITALLHRHATGAGQHIKFAQRETVLFTVPEPVLERCITGRVMGPLANGHPRYAPHGCYPCAGEDSWVVIAVTSEEEWRALCGVLARPELLDDPRFTNAAGRREHRADLDAAIETWTRSVEHHDAMARLQAAGVPAGAVLNTAELVSDPHYAARGFLPTVEYGAGVGRHSTMGFPWRFSRTPASIRMPTPLLGEHTREVLGELLGVTAEEYEALERAGVTGTNPVGAAKRSS
jgi:crotonobetainyl-CoA:carnitine CoA-transferase CaiB-like acyl-CoA transferase